MKLYKITIRPSSSFVTSLKGDTLFGQICWAVFHQFGKDRLSKLLEDYKKGEQPFLIVSDAFPTGYLPKPKMPSYLLHERSEEKKINRKKLWLTLDELMGGEYSEARMNYNPKKNIDMHNTINYKTFHTEKGFDPYGQEALDLSLQDIYILLDEKQLCIEDFKEAFALVSQMGYGKKASVGKGRFEYQEDDIRSLHIDSNSDAFMTLGPFSPKDISCKNIYYEPFTRFGKFGGERVYKNPFKKPILLADTASVVEFDKKQTRQYLGRPISGLTDIPEYSDTVHQGYSIVLPLKEKS